MAISTLTTPAVTAGSTSSILSDAVLSQIKRTLQDHLKSGIVIIIGSGLSCAEGLPGMKALTNHLEKAALPTGVGTVEWATILQEIKDKGLEGALKTQTVHEDISNFIRSEIALAVSTAEEHVIAEVITTNRILKFSRLLQYLPQDNRFAVITTNYDRLIELAAESVGFLVDTRSRGNHFAPFSKSDGSYAFAKNIIQVKGGIRKIENKVISLYKPHGSLDWADHQGRPVRCSFNLGSERALIITPGVSKYRAGYNQPFDMHRELANEAIDKADKLLVIGYGFNDDHLETHLSAKIKSGTQTVILAHTLTDNAKSYLTACPNSVWGIEASPSALGTLVHNNNSTYFLENESLWDTEGFVKGVLEI